jgi:protein TonB
MPRDLFGDVSDPRVRVGSRKWYTVPLSLFVHTLVLLLVVVIPLVATGALPDPRRIPEVFTIVEPAIPPAPPVRHVPKEVEPRADPSIPPREAPRSIEDEPPDWVEPNLPEAVGVPGGSVVDGSPDAVAPPPPPPPVKPPEPVRIGGIIRAPERIGYLSPVYPPIAQAARIQGVVIIEATIGIDGRVINARLLRSVAMLDEAALAAVRQWTYTPTTLNGVPVPVIMTVTVNFQLQK